jgi:broad specificity phosphatase PhoE
VTTVYLARHGESDWNVERRWQGHADRPLTERGREQARALAKRLAAVDLEAVYASDLRRAWETAETVAASRGLEVVRLPELREVDVGSWSGFTRDECAERYPDAFVRWQQRGTGWEDGESYEDMGARIVGVIQRLAAEHPNGAILVVSHGGPIRAMHAHALGV